MQRTAVVVNSGLGDMSIGLEMAGFKVIAAYEADQKAAAVHRANLDAPVFPLPFHEESIRNVPRADLLAGKLCQLSPTPSESTMREDPRATGRDFMALLKLYRPRAFFVTFSASLMKGEQLHIFLKEAAGKYRCAYQILDVTRVTGAPVRERMAYMVGTAPEVSLTPELLEDSFPAPLPPERFLQFEEPVDPWYFKITVRPESVNRDRNRFYCWKTNAYVGTEFLWWNYWKIPLVDTRGKLRKITHREIANLKGFPGSYVLPDLKNRSWLYQKLMFADNVQVIRQIADELFRGFTEWPTPQQMISRGIQFDELFFRYLTEFVSIANIKRESRTRKTICDFELRMRNQTLYFELKCYSGRNVPVSRIETICERLSILSESGKPILVFANEVPEHVKVQCLEKFRVAIWDVQNLLWQFQEFEEIQNEFIALLDYSVSDIEPLPPVPNVFQEFPSDVQAVPQTPDSAMNREAAPEEALEADQEIDFEVKEKTPDWEERLRRIEPGREQFQEYEQFCIDILKFALGDYLTLWERQEQTDSGLHRFDLCCKIKNDVRQDFFDSMKDYFNTKYIVFEFKNYMDRISQKEIYTTEKYLYGTALRKVAIIVSRKGYDDNALRAAKGSLRESGKLILCLSDQDLLKMARIKTCGEEEPADFLGEMLDALLIHLEK